MDGKNASGRRVSLLNDWCESTDLPLRLVSTTSTISTSTSPSLASRTSSYISSPIGSPPIPQLIRSDSSDSTAMPSPTTPDDYNYESPLSHIPDEEPIYNPSAAYFVKQVNPYYPPAPLSHPNPNSALSSPYVTQTPPYHTRPSHQLQYLQQPLPPQLHLQQPLPISQAVPHVLPSPHLAHPDSESRPAGPASGARSKKNSYPCPLAKQYNCSDFFTTSGHAARHAKKHTGKKDALCPECNKSFTRKDNMEQHRRTHQNGRNASKGADNAAKKAKQQGKRPKLTPIQQSSIPHPMAQPNLMLAVDPKLTSEAPFDVSPAQSYSYPDPSGYAVNPAYPTQYHGLDALASAASTEQRKFDN